MSRKIWDAWLIETRHLLETLTDITRSTRSVKVRSRLTYGYEHSANSWPPLSPSYHLTCNLTPQQYWLAIPGRYRQSGGRYWLETRAIVEPPYTMASAYLRCQKAIVSADPLRFNACVQSESSFVRSFTRARDPHNSDAPVERFKNSRRIARDAARRFRRINDKARARETPFARLSRASK